MTAATVTTTAVELIYQRTGADIHLLGSPHAGPLVLTTAMTATGPEPGPVAATPLDSVDKGAGTDLPQADVTAIRAVAVDSTPTIATPASSVLGYASRFCRDGRCEGGLAALPLESSVLLPAIVV